MFQFCADQYECLEIFAKTQKGEKGDVYKRQGMAILDAGVRSCNSGRLELVNNWAWQIG